jgi:hypothetical protein
VIAISAREFVFVKYGATFCARIIKEGFFARKIYARDDKEGFFCSYVPCVFYARQIFKRFALGIVFYEQKETTFEVTDASLRAATCQSYARV